MEYDYGVYDYDVIVIGGSFSGMSASLQLVRARKNVLVLDGGLPRNRFAKASYGFLGQDGRAPNDILADARAQLMKYPTLSWKNDLAITARRSGRLLEVETQDGLKLSARALILATGVTDTLPDIPGIAERWGGSVFHCPYCHGYELNQQAMGVLASSALAMHQALMLPDWGPTTLFLNNAFDPDETQLSQLARRHVTLERTPVRKITGDKATMILEDGRQIHLAGLLIQTRTDVTSPLAQQLGCTFADGPLGAFIQTDAMMETSIPGVFACGDNMLGAGAVALAVGNGGRAGAAAHHSLMFWDDA
ncbi:NAD(P)/FAD-dependent oxidoreductase [Thalassospira mesophila]|uniref:Thioredoxin reductase n=1 Tax=Thalassospira mesophila TaxID=1293891 RepID=A0A1Y2L3Q7_9PROT|nr:NAD(P)/FAD-dependent oxidoreductase [Thalassospira mesophila]OSQ40455.1 thioredoxin reductase [Thalassospira mesophila]